MKYTRGTNQFKKRRKENWRYTLFVGLTFIVFLCVLGATIRKEAIENVYAQEVLLSPVADPTPTPIYTPKTSEQELILKDIKDVFGIHADQALLLLTCENASHNPKIVNQNHDKAGNPTSKDWGVFQINDYWQGVTNPAFLTDYRINIRMAYNIFQRDGYSFKLWTCGRKLGI